MKINILITKINNHFQYPVFNLYKQFNESIHQMDKENIDINNYHDRFDQCQNTYKCQRLQNQSLQQSLESSIEMYSDRWICQKHQKKIGNFFCKTCYTFNICSSCIIRDHSGPNHEIVNFFETNQGIQMVKQYLLETIQETLKRMKSRQNQMKNGINQIDLMNKGIMKFKEQLLEQTRVSFRQIEKAIQQSFKNNLSQEQLIHSIQFQNFNKKDNQLTEEIRTVLLDIVDSKIDILSFNKQMVVKSPPQLPNFRKLKNHLEKQRKIFKEIKIQIETFNDKVLSKLGKKKVEICSQKYQKFIVLQKCIQDEPKQSFIKTLRIMDKQNIPSFNILNRKQKLKIQI